MLGSRFGFFTHYATSGLALICSMAAVFGLDAENFAVQVTAQVQNLPPRIRLEWLSGTVATSYRVSRKLLHEGTWRPLANLPGHASSYTDTAVVSGAAYEYEIAQENSDGITAYGYIYAGIEFPLPGWRGRVVLVLDDTHSSELASELDQLSSDLTGDGWTVLRRQASRSASPAEVKTLVRSAYNADPVNTKAVFLFGHVPVPYSGSLNPDLHPGHVGAWPADVFYGDMEGTWTDDSVHSTTAEDPRNHNVPGDGKYDQSQIPGRVVLQVGRVDLSDLPAFAPRTEVELLRQYLNKNHAFRHKLTDLERRGLIRDNFGEIEGDAPATDAWRSFAPFFGSDHIKTVLAGDFFSTLAGETYLWAYGGGGGGYYHADGVGSTSDFARQSPRAAFFMLHGSYFGDWDTPDNFLRAALATPGLGLAAAWTGLPHWYLHHMALGETIGWSTLLVQNNRGIYQNQINLSAGQVHIALMGDPTLRMHVVAPPRDLRAVVSADGTISLNWASSADALHGYYVFRADSASGPFARITRSFITGNSYTDTAPPEGPKVYMVRGVKLETSASGTYYNMSQGVFATAQSNGTLPIVRIDPAHPGAAEAGPIEGGFIITRTGATSSPLSIDLTVSGTALNGTDYEPISSSVAISENSATAGIFIRPIADQLVEGDETVVLTLAPSSAYAVGLPSSATVLIQDSPVNQPPTLSPVPDQTIAATAFPALISFTVADPDTPVASLSVSAASSDPALFPSGGLVLGGESETRTLVLTPASNQVGTAAITLVVSDGSGSASQSFQVIVTPGDMPKISSIRRQADTSMLILFEGAAGRAYTVETSADLRSWTALQSGIFGSNNTTNVLDQQLSVKRRFYRVQSR